MPKVRYWTTASTDWGVVTQIVVEAVPAFHIFYATGWQRATLQHRFTLPNQQTNQVPIPAAFCTLS